MTQKQFRLSRLSAHDIPRHMAKRGHKIGYSGDVDMVDHDGVFYSLDPDQCDCVSAGRIVSSDDGKRWIEDLTVVLPSDLGKLAQALDCGGLMDHDASELCPEMIIECLIGYGCYDQNSLLEVYVEGARGKDPSVLQLTENQAINMALGFALN